MSLIMHHRRCWAQLCFVAAHLCFGKYWSVGVREERGKASFFAFSSCYSESLQWWSHLLGDGGSPFLFKEKDCWPSREAFRLSKVPTVRPREAFYLIRLPFSLIIELISHSLFSTSSPSLEFLLLKLRLANCFSGYGSSQLHAPQLLSRWNWFSLNF